MRPRSGFVIYQLSGQLHRGSSPLPKSSNIEKAARGFPFSFYHIRKPARRASRIDPSLLALPAALAHAIRRRRFSFLKKKKDINIILLSENDTLPSNF